MIGIHEKNPDQKRNALGLSYQFDAGDARRPLELDRHSGHHVPENRRHYGDLLRLSEEGIASNILANRLARLVQSGLLLRTDDPTHKQKATVTASLKRLFSLSPCFSPTRGRMGMSVYSCVQATPRSAPSFLKRAASEGSRRGIHGRAPEAFIHGCARAAPVRSALNFKPLLSSAISREANAPTSIKTR